MSAARLDAAERTLPSGLRVVAAARGGAPMAELRLVVPFGGADPLHLETAELLTMTLFGGTRQRDRAAIDAELACLGAALNATVRPEYLMISGYAFADGLGRLLGLLADVLTGAAYPDQDVAIQRTRLGHRLQVYSAQPEVIARALLLRRCFGDHPAAREAPRETALDRVGTTDIRRLHAAGLTPAGACLVLVGDLPPQRLLDLAAAALDRWHSDRQATPLAPPRPVSPGEVEVIDQPGNRPVMVGLAGPAPAETDPGYPAALLANLVFSGYFASRLYEQLRETLGLVYTCRSGFAERAGIAAVLLEYQTDAGNAGPAMAQTHAELCRVARTRPPGTDEIDAARGYAIGSQTVAMSTQAGLADTLAMLVLRGHSLCWLTQRAELLATVPGGEVRDYAARLFRPAALTGFVAGPVAALADTPSPLGGLLRTPAEPSPLPRHSTSPKPLHKAGDSND